MSEQDRSEWQDATGFDALAGEPDDGFADFEADYFDGPDEPSAVVPEAEDDTVAAAEPMPEPPVEAEAPVAAVPPRRGRVISGGELGFLFTAAVLVAAVGVGAACLLLADIAPTSLWRPAELLDYRAYLDLAHHPINVLALVLLASVGLALLGAWAVARAARQAGRRLRVAESMLDKITALRLEDEGAWLDAGFKAQPAAAAFTSSVLGAWRLQHARQRRYMGLEGELHRLQKALADNSRSDLTGRFDNPAVGSLSDEMVRYFDERAAAVQELEETRARHRSDAPGVISLLQDARAWNRSSLDQVNAQAAALVATAQRLQSLADKADEKNSGVVSPDLEGLIGDLRRELDDVQAGGPAGIEELVDQGSKLAFQIAMEVARLGPRGERLQPLTQALEELTTNFRQVVDRAAGAGDLTAARSLLVELGHRLSDAEPSTATDALIMGAGEAGTGVSRAAENLSALARRFQGQAERLVNLGESLAELTGAVFEPEAIAMANPENPPEPPLALEGADPFADAGLPGEEPDVERPVAVRPTLLAGGDHTPDPEFSRSTLPTMRPTVPTAPTPAPAPAAPVAPEPLELERSFDFEPASPLAAAPAAPPRPAEPAPSPLEPLEFDLPEAQPLLSSPEETVYDLNELGAEPLPADAGPVRDLMDFGAVPLQDAADEDQVHDLSEFDAVPLSSAAASAGADDRIYDLSEFGAVPVN